MKVTFLPQNIVGEIFSGMSILDAAALARVPIDGNCAGTGTCGKCKVRVAAGNESRLEEQEKNRLTRGEIQTGYRLACKFIPTGDVTVQVPMVEGATERKTTPVKMPENFFPVNSFMENGEACYGIAFDMGTTTVVGMMWKLSDGSPAGIIARTNPQSVYGADVVSRILYAGESEENLKSIHGKMIDCFNEIIAELVMLQGVSRESIRAITAVGNTTMSHLFMGIDPEPLAAFPFAPVFLDGKNRNASSLGIAVGGKVDLYLMANIAGHVGSDMTAGLIASGMTKNSNVTLQIDVGTNGEIALCGKGRVLVCSTAAGPAFEGASIFQGMRAAAGAIENVKITDRGVELRVIDNEKPIGICGSGIIDAVASLLENGLIDETGRFADAEIFLENGASKELAERLRIGEHGKEFVLSYAEEGEDVVILQKDIREVQIAKAAIYAGIKILVKELEVEEEDIEHINIAGAFGNYIKIESALVIGLFPKVARNRIESIGNAAGIGASMALLSDLKREEAETLAKTAEHIELSTCSEFQEEFLAAMKFSGQRLR